MKSLALISVILLPSCALYFGENEPYPPQPPDMDRPDEDDLPGDEQPPPGAFARCEDGNLFVIGDSGSFDMPGHGAGTPSGRCAGACRSAIVECVEGDCTEALAQLCDAPEATGATCAIEGTSCSGDETASCAQTTRCGQIVDGGDCACNGSTFDCSTPAADVHAALVGKWKGMVTTEWEAPYEISLWIYPDGTYWAECIDDTSGHCLPFYYGGDGPHPWRRITVLSVSDSLGVAADIGMFESSNVGAISALAVTDSALTFTLNAAWHNCAQPIYVTLARQ